MAGCPGAAGGFESRVRFTFMPCTLYIRTVIQHFYDHGVDFPQGGSGGRLLQEKTMKTVTIYTDGACSGNPGPGGQGAIFPQKA